MMINWKLTRLAFGAAGLLIGTILLGLTASATAVAQGFLTGRVLARVISGYEFDELLAPLVAVAVLIAARGVLVWAQNVVASMLGASVKLRLRRRLYERLLNLGPGFTSRLSISQVQSTLGDGLELIDPYVSKYLPQALIALIVPTGIVVYVATIDLAVAAAILVSCLVIAFGPRIWESSLGKAGEEHWETWTTVAARFVEGILGMNTLKAFNASRRFGQSLRDEAVRLYLATRHLMLISLATTFLVGLTHSGGLAFVAIAGTYRYSQGAINAEQLLILLFLAGEAYRPLNDLTTYWHQGYFGVSASAGVFAVIEAPDTLEIQSAPVTPIPPSPLRICFEEVSYTYPTATRPALTNLSLDLKTGRTIALVGRSGSGKTTVMSLLLRSFDPTRGRVTLNGVDVRELDLDRYRQLFAVVSQDVFLFHGTIAENLRMAKPDATVDELAAAASSASIDRFIESLPDRYETLVGERGVRFSGGERQRIALARAFLKNAPVLILDEPTSSLDGENERNIRDALERLRSERATLVITHRLSAVDFADTIYMLEEGSIIEVGNPRELLSQSGPFAELVEAQVAGA